MLTKPPAALNGRPNRTEPLGVDETDRTPTPVGSGRHLDEKRTGTEHVDDAPTADGSLVVLDPDAPSTTLQTALQHPDVSDEDLHLLIVFPLATFESRRRALLKAGATAPYTVSDFEAEAQRIAYQVGREWLAPMGVTFEPMGAVGRHPDCVRMAVEERGCARAFVSLRPALWQRLRGVGDFDHESLTSLMESDK